MIRLSLRQIAAITGGSLLPGSDAGLEIVGLATDSRQPLAGELFVALSGQRFDGHDYVAAALAQGAAAALVARPLAAPGVLVADTLVALQALAAHWRRQFTLPVVAITGSCGKTTVKEILAAILAQEGPVLASRGNQNNHIGVPLTLARLGAEHRYAVLEMGMNHAGELALLTRLAQPRLALITNAAAAHLEGLGTVAAVAAAKGEILEGLEQQGTAVLNADDPFVEEWAEKVPGEVWRFTLEDRPARVRGRWEATGEGGHLEVRAPQGEFGLALPLMGRHNGANALAAATAALALGIPIATIQRGVATLRPIPGRLQWRSGKGGYRLLDDTYNANPASLEAAMQVLAAQAGRRILILGDMGELGPAAQAYHRQAGQRALALGIDALLALGPLAAEAAAAFGPGGAAFDQLETLLDAVALQLEPGCVVLVKGSRAAHMERVVAALSMEVA
ncbi:UDP-N-acetylmuramoyl-tripeptide--D-alanyl-D-alanine ligase [Acidithiobacillus sp.]